MKKALALTVVMVMCAAIGFAAAGEHSGKGMEGTITKVDTAGKSMVVKTADGKDMTIYWNDATKLQGTPKEGEPVQVKTSDKDGKTWATWVHVGKMEAKTSAQSK